MTMRTREHDRYWRTQMRDLQWFLVVVAVLGLVWWAVQASDAEGARPAVAPSVATPAPTSAVGRVWLVRGASGDQVRAVQTYLSGHGWSLAVDGHYGPVTEAVVTRVQAMSGLVADGIVGPVTWSAFGLNGAATAGTEADRAGGQVNVTPVPPPAGGCDEMSWHRRNVGLPEAFDAVGYRESRCRADAYNGRNRDESYGYWQINTKGALWGEIQWRCGVSEREQLFDPATNARCAKALYDAFGGRPWRL